MILILKIYSNRTSLNQKYTLALLNNKNRLLAAGYDERIYVSNINSMAAFKDNKENSDVGLKKFQIINFCLIYTLP